MHLIRLLLAIVACLALPGCTAISALDDASKALQVFELGVPNIATPNVQRRRVELVVEEPRASSALATERVMIRPGPLRAQYLPGVRWADTAPVMLQTLIVRSLVETGALGSVGRRPIAARADFSLLSELTDFQAETTPDTAGATIRVRLMVRLVRERNASVVASRIFSVSELAASTEPSLVVAALDRASGALLSEMVPWLLDHLKR